VLLYAAAVEATSGRRPRRVRLLYLGQRTVEAEVTEARLAGAVDALEATWSALRADVASDGFAPRPGPLCAWCPFASQCPEGTEEIARRERAASLLVPAEPLQPVA
jgi:putative RecB family exonuclease